MTFKELLYIFENRFPFAKYEDYRPICHELFTDGKAGITLFFKNGDIIEYYPSQDTERREEMSEKPQPIERCVVDVIEIAPCKVGDAVYVLVKDGKVKKYIVSGIIIDQNNTWIDIKEIDNPYGGGLLNALQFGEDVFHTREEAEAALLLQLQSGADMRGGSE